MPYAGLAEFLEELVAAGELARIAAPVDDDLEVAEITARVASAGGPALLFERGPTASSPGYRSGESSGGAGPVGPIVTNLLGTEARACRALGAPSYAALVERLTQWTRPGGAPSWLDRLRGAAEGPPLEKFRPKSVRQAACQQAVRLGKDIDLALLPAIRAWPGESSRSLTGRLISLTANGESVVSRAVRGVVIDRKHLAFSALDAIGAECWSPAAPRRPAALALGGDPSGILAAQVDWTGIDGHALAGCLRNQAWEVAPARSQPLSVPADAELVIEGALGPLDPNEVDRGAGESPFDLAAIALADSASGYYQPLLPSPASFSPASFSPAAPTWWLLEVSAITHRVNPVTPLSIVGDLSGGRPMGEAAVFAALRASLLTPLLKAAIPELVDCALPAIGGPQGFAVLAIRKTYPGQARRAANALWGLAPLETMRWVVVVDDDVDVREPAAVLSRVATHASADRDLWLQGGTGADLATSRAGLAEHVAIDATVKLPAECGRPWPEKLARPGTVRDMVTRRWKEYGLPPLG